MNTSQLTWQVNLSQLQDEIRQIIITKEYKFEDIAALDCIHDIDLALQEYIESFPNRIGQQYIYLYGTLQALFVLKDAVSILYRNYVDLSFSSYKSKTFKKVADIRNLSVGHPVKTDRGKKNDPSFEKNKGFSHFMNRNTISKEGFEIISVETDFKNLQESLKKPNSVNMPELIQECLEESDRLLTNVLKTLKKST